MFKMLTTQHDLIENQSTGYMDIRRYADRLTRRQTDRQTGRHVYRQAGRQAGRQTDRQASRQAGRQDTDAGQSRLYLGTTRKH